MSRPTASSITWCGCWWAPWWTSGSIDGPLADVGPCWCGGTTPRPVLRHRRRASTSWRRPTPARCMPTRRGGPCGRRARERVPSSSWSPHRGLRSRRASGPAELRRRAGRSGPSRRSRRPPPKPRSTPPGAPRSSPPPGASRAAVVSINIPVAPGPARPLALGLLFRPRALANGGRVRHGVCRQAEGHHHHQPARGRQRRSSGRDAPRRHRPSRQGAGGRPADRHRGAQGGSPGSAHGSAPAAAPIS